MCKRLQQRWAPLSLESGRGRHLPDRRQPFDQRRWHSCAALWQTPGTWCWPGSGLAGRPGLGRAQAAAEGQHGLRPEAAFHRGGRDSRHRHRGNAQALRPTAPSSHRFCRPDRSRGLTARAGAGPHRQRRSGHRSGADPPDRPGLFPETHTGRQRSIAGVSQVVPLAGSQQRQRGKRPELGLGRYAGQRPRGGIDRRRPPCQPAKRKPRPSGKSARP